MVAKVRDGEGGFGYNARTDTYEDLVMAGMIDRPRSCAARRRTPCRSHSSEERGPGASGGRAPVSHNGGYGGPLLALGQL